MKKIKSFLDEINKLEKRKFLSYFIGLGIDFLIYLLVVPLSIPSIMIVLKVASIILFSILLVVFYRINKYIFLGMLTAPIALGMWVLLIILRLILHPPSY